MREFSTAAWAAARTKDETEEAFGWPITVPIDGREVEFGAASVGQITMVIAAMEGDVFRKIATIINFFFSLVKDEDDRGWFKQRLYDSQDDFGPGMMEEITKAIIEEWGARPTQPASGSSDSPQATGPRSTARRHSKASTRSLSPSTAS
jgi:hypothetical protein